MFTMMMMLINSIFEQLLPRNSLDLTPKCHPIQTSQPAHGKLI